MSLDIRLTTYSPCKMLKIATLHRYRKILIINTRNVKYQIFSYVLEARHFKKHITSQSRTNKHFFYFLWIFFLFIPLPHLCTAFPKCIASHCITGVRPCKLRKTICKFREKKRRRKWLIIEFELHLINVSHHNLLMLLLVVNDTCVIYLQNGG